jgi:hypothetical protein
VGGELLNINCVLSFSTIFLTNNSNNKKNGDKIKMYIDLVAEHSLYISLFGLLASVTGGS